MENCKTLTVNINYLREKRHLCNRIKMIALNTSGILFGGVVRDDIIGKHYRSLFIKKELNFDKYWDSEYDPDTKHRLIIPNDIDVFFRADNNSTTFQNKVREFVKAYNGTYNITEDTSFRQFDYSGINQYLKHYIITINFRIGKTFFEKGMNMHLKIDLVQINNSRSFIQDNYEYTQFACNIEPPFNHIDFLCNVFITEKTSAGDYATRISNSTGTPLDDMTFSEKAFASASIITNIINFRTQFARSIGGYNAEFINCYRILKMINRSIPWTITNLPFKFVSSGDLREKLEDNCCICLQSMDGDSDDVESSLVELNTHKLPKSNYLHKSCFIEFLSKEQQQKFVNVDENRIECRCPFRGIFNFRDCYREIKY